MLANQWMKFIHLHVISFRGMELKFQLCCHSFKKLMTHVTWALVVCHLNVITMGAMCTI